MTPFTNNFARKIENVQNKFYRIVCSMLDLADPFLDHNNKNISMLKIHCMESQRDYCDLKFIYQLIHFLREGLATLG